MMSGIVHIISHLGVNCYLIEAGDGFVLIDTGFSSKRARIERDLEEAGLWRGKLKLIVVTHGDLDHTGNVTYFHTKYGAPVIMHEGDAGMAERGDTLYNRKGGLTRSVLLKAGLVLLRANRFENFAPDKYVEEGCDLSVFGLDARVVHTPGHSRGSISVLAASGDLFCGDLLANSLRPSRGRLIDNEDDFEASVRKLRRLDHIGTVYPGHGKPFRWEELRVAV